MTYGKGGPAGVITGGAILPNTGNNTTLFVLAAGLIVLGLVVMTASFFVARASR